MFIESLCMYTLRRRHICIDTGDIYLEYGCLLSMIYWEVRRSVFNVYTIKLSITGI